MPQLSTGQTSTRYTTTNTQPYKFHSDFTWRQSEPFFGDLGYSLPLPWPQVSTAGYLDGGNDNFQGGETPAPSNRLPEETKKLITSNEPEYYATNNRINQLGGIPEINVNDPKYSFKRSDVTHIVQ